MGIYRYTFFWFILTRKTTYPVVLAEQPSNLKTKREKNYISGQMSVGTRTLLIWHEDISPSIPKDRQVSNFINGSTLSQPLLQPSSLGLNHQTDIITDTTIIVISQNTIWTHRARNPFPNWKKIYIKILFLYT